MAEPPPLPLPDESSEYDDTNGWDVSDPWPRAAPYGAGVLGGVSALAGGAHLVDVLLGNLSPSGGGHVGLNQRLPSIFAELGLILLGAATALLASTLMGDAVEAETVPGSAEVGGASGELGEWLLDP